MNKFKILFKRSRKKSGAEESAITPGVLTPEEEFESTLKFAFDHYDINKNGKVEKHEFRAVIERYFGRTPTERQLSRLLAKVDLNHDGTVDFEEFKRMMAERRSLKMKMLTIFQDMDKNRDYLISKEELMIGLNEVDPVEEDEIDEILQAADIDKDNSINFREFLMYFV